MDTQARIGESDKQNILFMITKMDTYVANLDGIRRYEDFSQHVNRYALLWWQLHRISSLITADEDDWIDWLDSDKQLLPAMDATLVAYQRHCEISSHPSTARSLGYLRGDIHRLEALVGWLADAQMEGKALKAEHYRGLAEEHLDQIHRRLATSVEALVKAHHLLESESQNKEAPNHE